MTDTPEPYEILAVFLSGVPHESVIAGQTVDPALSQRSPFKSTLNRILYNASNFHNVLKNLDFSFAGYSPKIEPACRELLEKKALIQGKGDSYRITQKLYDLALDARPKFGGSDYTALINLGREKARLLAL